MKAANLWVTVFALALASNATAQHDSSYYETHNDVTHIRLFAIQKHSTLTYKNSFTERSSKYSPHVLPGLGLGFTYNWLTLNVSYGLPLYGEERGKGKTKYVDIELHAWAKKFVLDFVGRRHKGMYVPGDQDALGNFDQRQDLESRLLGGAFQYVLNNKRFSLRSSFLQTDWQKKSAGSLLIGFNAYVGRITADSSLLAGNSDLDPAGLNERKDLFWQIGPTIGYAYTLVIKRHVFLTGSFVESLNYSRHVPTGQMEQQATSKFAINPSFRIVAGYNTYRWGMGISYVNNRVNVATATSGNSLAISSGTYRVNLVYRLRSKGKLGALIDKI